MPSPIIILGLGYAVLFAGTAFSAVPELHINHRAFADALTNALYSKENECTSAWGVSLAFSLVYPTSVGDSEQEIRNVLGYPSTGSNKLQLVWNDTSTRMEASYQGECLYGYENECEVEEPTLEIANSVWFHNEFELEQTYVALVESFAEQIDFSDDGAGEIVNEWVNASTRGLIDSILPDGPIDGYLVAVNSIYLKAQWDGDPFRLEMTTTDTFYTSVTQATTATASTAHFMHAVLNDAGYSSVAVPGFQILRLVFFTGDLSMIVALPTNENSGVATSVGILSALSSLNRTRVALALPRFQFESEYKESLMSALQALGMTAPFIGNMCPFSNSFCVQITEIIQKTFIDLNEDGIEAAAATAITLGKGAPPVTTPILMVVDHPFQFFVYDAVEEMVIFEGRVGNPGIVEGAAEPQLQASHSDDDFWMTYFGDQPARDIEDVDAQGGTEETTSNSSSDSEMSSGTSLAVASSILRAFVQLLCSGYMMLL